MKTHLGNSGIATIAELGILITIKCNHNFELVGTKNYTTCDICNDKLNGNLPICKPSSTNDVMSTKQPKPSSSTDDVIITKSPISLEGIGFIIFILFLIVFVIVILVLLIKYRARRNARENEGVYDYSMIQFRRAGSADRTTGIRTISYTNDNQVNQSTLTRDDQTRPSACTNTQNNVAISNGVPSTSTMTEEERLNRPCLPIPKDKGVTMDAEYVEPKDCQEVLEEVYSIPVS
jgi:hypothetical protein